MKNLSLLFLALVANSVQAFPLEESMKFQLQSRDVVQGLASQACTDVFIIVVRGTGDQIPNSQVDYSAKVACDSLSSCSLWDLPYPAALYDGNNPGLYEASTKTGTFMLASAIDQYAGQCPKSKIAVMAMSGGSAVGSYTMCGNDAYNLGPYAGSGQDQVFAVALMAPPTLFVGASFLFTYPSNVMGKSTYHGDAGFPDYYTGCNKWESKMAAWCDEADNVCNYQAGSPISDFGDHAYALGKFQSSAGAWVASKYLALPQAALPQAPVSKPVTSTVIPVPAVVPSPVQQSLPSPIQQSLPSVIPAVQSVAIVQPSQVQALQTQPVTSNSFPPSASSSPQLVASSSAQATPTSTTAVQSSGVSSQAALDSPEPTSSTRTRAGGKNGSAVVATVTTVSTERKKSGIHVVTEVVTVTDIFTKYYNPAVNNFHGRP